MTKTRSATRTPAAGAERLAWRLPCGRMVILRGVLRFVLIWVLSGVAAPYVKRGFGRLAKLTPDGSFLEATLLELSAGYSAVFVTVVAELLTAATIESLDFLFM